MLIELEIFGLANLAEERGALVLLREKEGQRRMVPVMTSQRRAMILLSRDKLRHPLPAPPSATDVCLQMMTHFGVRMRYVRITAVRDGLCFCSVVGESGGQDYVVNYCQAADGLIIAVTFHCPIYIDESLMELQYMRDMGGGGFALNINNLTRGMISDALSHAIDIEDYETATILRDELQKRDGDTDPKYKTTLDSLLEDGDDGQSQDA